MSTIVLVGSLDTKGEEYRFARDRLRALGVDTVVLDTGTVGAPAFEPDISAAEVAAGGGDLEELRAGHDRARAHEVMGRGAAALVGDLLARRRLDGAFALGGSGNTTVAATAFRDLPVGVPKLILTTMTAGNVRGFVGESDLVLAASVVDIAGLNRISRLVIANAAAAVAGMVTAPPAAAGEARPLIAASTIGLTTRAVTAARQRLEQLGYEVVVFHMTGAGGVTMESLIDRGEVIGVLDLTTSELANELGGGICSAGPGRLTAAARRGIPQVVAPGGMDMINFGRSETVPDRYAGRVIHAHNSEITLVRTSVAESAELGRRLVRRVSGDESSPASGTPAAEPAGKRGAAAGLPVVLLPSGGLSAIDEEGHPFHDAAADRELLDVIRSTADPGRVRIVNVTGNIDRPEVGVMAADLLHELVLARDEPARAASPRALPDGAQSTTPGGPPCTP